MISGRVAPRGRRRSARWPFVTLGLVLSLLAGVAWAFWTASSAPGGNGASAATQVLPGSTPNAVASGRSVAISWAASTLVSGDAVTGYTLRRYDATTLAPQSIGAGCAGVLTSLSCTESKVPAGEWVYSVTPRFATSWTGPESLRSASVRVVGARLVLDVEAARSGTSVAGDVADFLAGDTLSFRLDSPTGPIVSGTLAGTPTPAAVPASGGGAIVVTLPSGLSQGNHRVYAVASPSGDAAAADLVVDDVPPPALVLTQTPMAVSGDAATFAWQEPERGATVECRIDAQPFAPCENPVAYSELTAGSHSFAARATDSLGNVGAATTYTWTVNLTVPTVAIGFPSAAGHHNDAGLEAGCDTPVGDVCGVAADDISVSAVHVSLRRTSTGLWWNGTTFSSTTETWLLATGTNDWSRPLAATALPEGDFTLRARASDGTNLGYDSRTFTVDRTAPGIPTLTSTPPPTAGPTATFAFTTADATATFECRLDAGTWSACSSPRTYDGLASGSHTVNVRAVDRAGNVSPSTSTTWTVDADPPTATMTFPTATVYNGAGWTAGCGTPTTGDLCGVASDTGSGLAEVAVSLRSVTANSYWNGSSFAASTETWVTASGTSSWSYLFAESSFPSDGTYVVRLRAKDQVGNTTTSVAMSITVDRTPPPAPRIDRSPTNPSGQSVSFDFSATEPGTTFQCRLDAGAWTTCTSPTSYTGLSEGPHTFEVRSRDLAGNLSNATSYSWSVDAGLPTVDITSPVAGSALNDASYAAGCGTPGGDICGTAADPGGGLAGVAVSIQRGSTSRFWDGSGFVSDTEVFLPATGTTTWSLGLAAAALPADDTYVVRARATDTVGLASFDTTTFTMDRTAPAAPSITGGPSGRTNAESTFAFTGEPAATFQCRLDGAAWSTCTSATALDPLPDGQHTFEVRAIDRAGNTGVAASRSWTVDRTAPVVATTFPTAGGAYNNASWAAGCSTAADDFCGTAVDASGGTVASVEVNLRRTSTGLYWNGSSFSAAAPTWLPATGTSAWSRAFTGASFPGDGAYVVSVRATDTTGNVSVPAETTLTIDRSGPTAAAVASSNRGATLRRIEAGDQLTLTFSEPIAPSSLIAGWNGTGTQNITIRQANSSTNDSLSFYNSANSVRLPLGSVTLGRGDYVTGNVVWGSAAAALRSTLTMSGTTLTLTFGTPDQPARVTTATATGNMSWTPRTGVTTGTGITDLVGNFGTTTARTESDNDNDF